MKDVSDGVGGAPRDYGPASVMVDEGGKDTDPSDDSVVDDRVHVRDTGSFVVHGGIGGRGAGNNEGRVDVSVVVNHGSEDRVGRNESEDDGQDRVESWSSGCCVGDGGDGAGTNPFTVGRGVVQTNPSSDHRVGRVVDGVVSSRRVPNRRVENHGVGVPRNLSVGSPSGVRNPSAARHDVHRKGSQSDPSQGTDGSQSDEGGEGVGGHLHRNHGGVHGHRGQGRVNLSEEGCVLPPTNRFRCEDENPSQDRNLSLRDRNHHGVDGGVVVVGDPSRKRFEVHS